MKPTLRPLTLAYKEPPRALSSILSFNYYFETRSNNFDRS